MGLGKFLCKKAQAEYLAGDPAAAAAALAEAESVAVELNPTADTDLGKALAKVPEL
jgi:hypothetical protein